MNTNDLEDNSFKAQCMALGPLETFDPNAFRGDETVQQEVCNFVLALALAFNDLKDIFYGHIVLQGYKPLVPDGSRTRAFGLYSGMNLHFLRLLIATVHELLALIQEEEAATHHAAFRETVRLLPRECRDAWNEVMNVALNRESKTEIGKVLLIIRNKVAFHYDAKVIQTGYQRHFFGSKKEDDRAYVSRGENMQETRFYFADAAANGVLMNRAGTRPVDFVGRLMDTINRVSISLRYIVTGFIQHRKCSFRSEAEC